MQRFREIDVHDLLGLMNAEDPMTLVDVRTPGEIARGVIPGAENWPLDTLAARENDLPADNPVVLYCQTGARSAQACAYLAARGHDNVINLRGGIMAWLQAGYAATTERL